VIGRRSSLLLEAAGLNEDEDASPSESGATEDATVPGITVCWARTAEASKKIEQLALQIISALPTLYLLADEMPLH